jgi:iron complex outermembrane receptor protein
MSSRPSTLIILVFLFAATVAAHAQTAPSLTGVVRDPSGAVVPEASITVTPHAVGPARSARTDGDGRFALTLPPGRYVLRVERAGFAPLQRDAVEIADGQPTDLELTLAQGGVSESVTVLATRSRLATKAETPIMQTPQAITVVPEEVLDQQAATTLGEAIRNVSGVALAGSWRGSYEVFAQRGFYSDSDGNFRRNGIEISKFTSILSPNAERIEVLKGPASVLYGRIDPGGVINVVTRRPQPVRFSELDLRGGAFGYVDGRFDTTGPIGDGSRTLYRLNVSSDRTGSYRDEVEKRNTYILPSITTFLGSRARWDIDVEYKDEEKTDDVGIAAPENNFDALDAMPIETFLGEPEAGVDLWYANGVSTFEHMLGSSWTFRNTLSYIHYDSTSRGVSLGSLAADRRTVSRFAGFSESKLGSALAEVSVLGSFSTGPLQHRVAAGGSYHHYSQDQQGSNAAIAGVDIYDPVYTGLPAEPSVLSGDTLLTVGNSGLFIQDQIEVTPRLHLQIGARASAFKQETDNRLTARTQVHRGRQCVDAGVRYTDPVGSVADDLRRRATFA